MNIHCSSKSSKAEVYNNTLMECDQNTNTDSALQVASVYYIRRSLATTDFYFISHLLSFVGLLRG